MDFLRILQLIGYVLRISQKPPRRNRWNDIKRKHEEKMKKEKEANVKKRPLLKVV